ncbi:MAG: tryptophan 7-halogenase [Vicinamibacterales bacterium]|nr:tryptophan 7-halogenase [Vicinamibacterales bacterium]
MAAHTVDAVIIGGGPAGAAAARLLAAWGHSVQLLTKTVDRSRSLGESLPPSCRKLFDLLGATEAIDAAGFLAGSGNTVWWGDQTTRSASFADGSTGLQVVRCEFDAVLLRLAAEAGARVVTDAHVHDAQLAPADVRPGPAGATVTYATADTGTHVVEGRFVLDCSGRAGVIARRGYRVHDVGCATLALTAVWTRHDGWDLDDDTHTLVETYGDGWVWSVPVTPSRRYVTVMVDPRVTDLERGGVLTACYEAELAKTVAFRRVLDGATRETTPWGCDASLYHARTCGGPGMLLVGDAASCINPLSSYGVKKALASAWLAAVVAHTSLTNASLAAMALDLFNQRELEIHTALSNQAARFFAEAAAQHLHPFWTGRSTSAELTDAPDAKPTVDIDALRQDPAVLAAFDTLRRGDEIRLRRGDRLRIAARPALTTREVVLQDRLILPSWPDVKQGIRYLRNVDLVRLVELAPDHRQVPDLFEAYTQRCAAVSLPDFLGALSVLLAKGALRNDPT